MRRPIFACLVATFASWQAHADTALLGPSRQVVSNATSTIPSQIVRDLATGRPVYSGFGKLDAMKTVFGGAALDALYPQHRRLVTKPDPNPSVQPVSMWRRLKIDSEYGGHFFLTAEVRHRPPSYFRTSLRFLIDTGASTVALSQSDAEALGFKLREEDFTGISMTANGPVPHAPVTLPELRVRTLKVKNVQATVLASGLDISLLGMSFLNRLRRYSVEDGQLVLEW